MGVTVILKWDQYMGSPTLRFCDVFCTFLTSFRAGWMDGRTDGRNVVLCNEIMYR